MTAPSNTYSHSMDQRLKIWIVDDLPIKSALPKLKDIAFLNSAPEFGTGEKALAEINRMHKYYGAVFEVLSPEQLYQKKISSYVNTILLIDVNWIDGGDQFESTRDLPEYSKSIYGIELAQHALNMRSMISVDSSYLIFFSNSRQDKVDDMVRTWKNDLNEKNIYPLYVGAGSLQNNSREVQIIWHAVMQITKDALRKVSPNVRSEIHQNVYEHLSNGKQYLTVNDLAAGHEEARVDGVRIGDLAQPFVGYYEREELQQAESLRIIAQMWLDCFDIRNLRLACFTSNHSTDRKNAEALRVLQSLFRYEKVDFLDMYVFGQPLDSELTNPERVLNNRLEKGLLDDETKGINIPSFCSRLNRQFSNPLGGQLDKEIANEHQGKKVTSSIPSILRDRDVFDVQRDRRQWNHHALITVHKQKNLNGVGLEWILNIKPIVALDNPEWNARISVIDYYEGLSELKEMLAVFQKDPDHLEVLEILANELPKSSITLTDEEKWSLIESFERWEGRLRLAIIRTRSCVEQIVNLESSHSNTNLVGRRLNTLRSELVQSAEKLQHWEMLANLFKVAAKFIRNNVSKDGEKQTFKDFILS